MHYNIGYYALYVYVIRILFKRGCLHVKFYSDILFAYANVDAFIYF